MSCNAPFIHIVHGTTRQTPCERALLLGECSTILPFDVTCPTCLESDIYWDMRAALMEKALEKPTLILMDELGVVHESWVRGEVVSRLKINNSSSKALSFMLKREPGGIVQFFHVDAGATLVWQATPDTVFIA